MKNNKKDLQDLKKIALDYFKQHKYTDSVKKLLSIKDKSISIEPPTLSSVGFLAS